VDRDRKQYAVCEKQRPRTVGIVQKERKNENSYFLRTAHCIPLAS
jgi:hypothetical protein